MAELNEKQVQKKRKGSAIFSKRNLRVDLTPMVDLGFILVTFFVFTTTLSQQKVMEVVNPNDAEIGINDELCESCVLTVLLDRDNKIWYYEGAKDKAEYKETGYGADGIRKLIADKKKSVKQQFKLDKFVLIIKPLNRSGFKNLVDIIDESNINLVKRYYIDEPTESELERFQ
ncbi:MAG: biopolymer transporter ExbD [Chitinophagaceae bacterium]|nr:MAG: biopolymer transporter ExbD [Chitinophagaceae bacterium]